MPWIVAGAVFVGIAVLGVVLLVILWAAPMQNPPLAQPVAQVVEQPVPPPIQVAPQLVPPAAVIPPGPVPAQIDAAAVRTVKQATVYLRVHLPNGGSSEGSGFFALEPGIVITNAHVLGMLRTESAPPRNVDVVLHSGEPAELKMTAAVLGVDRTNDLAVLRVDGDPGRLPPPLPVDSANKLFETQKVYVFGFPLGAELGKAITVSESSVSSLRRNEDGTLNRVQVNGGMHQGNSGGPVTNAAGLVVGVSVSGYIGTQINFAIPGDLVKQALDGHFAGTNVGLAYRADSQIRLPVKIKSLDPLNRIREVHVETWSGPAGGPRPGGVHAPGPVAGDGPRLSSPALPRAGAHTADVTLPQLAAGQVCWLQPVLVNAAGAKRWDTAIPVPAAALVPLERKAALVQFKPPAARIDRTFMLRSIQTVSLYERKQRRVFADNMDADLLESLNPDPRGIGTFTRLTLGNCNYRQELGGQIAVPAPEALAILARFSPTFLVDAANACKERGNRTFNALNPLHRKMVESMYELICNTFESTTLPLPNRTVQPLESWPARMPMFVLVRGQRRLQDIHVTCTYEGIRSMAGRPEAVITLAGEIKGRGPRANLVLGKARGHAHVDIEQGFLTQVRLVVATELEIQDTGLRVLVSDENTINRSAGNSLGIAAADKTGGAAGEAKRLKPPPSLSPPKTPPAATGLPGLLAYWSFDEVAAQGKVADLSGKGQDGKAVGASQIDGIGGKALALRGSSSYFDLGTSPTLNHQPGAPFTLSFWMKTRAASATIVSQRHSKEDGAVIDIAVEGGRLTATVRPNGGLLPAKISNPFSVNDDRWHHCALTRNGNAIELFVDGSPQGTAKAAGLDGPITTDGRFVGRESRWLQQGRQQFLGVNAFLDGAVDELCIFNRTLTREELRLLAGR